MPKTTYEGASVIYIQLSQLRSSFVSIAAEIEGQIEGKKLRPFQGWIRFAGREGGLAVAG
jgi:hypothetical protein